MTRKNVTSLAIVVAIGLLFQVGFVVWDCKSTPADTAVSFTRDYYRLSPSMARWMCGTSSTVCCKSVCGSESATYPKATSGNESVTCPKAASGSEPVICPKTASGNHSTAFSKTDSCNASARCVTTAIENYLYEAGLDAAERGFGKNYAKYTLSHIETRTEYLDDATALVHLTAHRRIAINPLYAYVARLFRIGDTYEVDESIQVKLEDGRWRVCQSSLLSL